MAKVKLKTSAVVDRQVPEFVREDHQKFIKFLEAYYEWLEQNYKTRDLENLADIDSTLDEYVEYFADQFIATLPRAMVVDRRIIVKHAKEIYLAKGTPKSYDLLFRLMFNEEPQQIYYPKQDMLRVSDGKWSQSYILRGKDVSGDSFELIGETVTQIATSVFDNPASARVEAVVKYNVGQQVITEITLNANSIIGQFEPNQPIKGISNRTGSEIVVDLIPFINDLDIAQPGRYNVTGDIITIDEGDGTDARAEINTVKTGGIDDIFIADGGDNHYVGQPVLFDNSDAGFGLSSKVEGAIAEVSEVYFGSFLLESAQRFKPNYLYDTGERIIYKQHEYEVVSSGTTGNAAPTHVFGTQPSGTTFLKHVGRASSKLLDENSDEISLERTRYYKVDSYGNYDPSIPVAVLNDGFGPIQKIKILSAGSSYNKLPKVVVSTDFISDIKTTAGSNIITVKTTLLHELIIGQQVTISGTFNREVDGTWTVNTIVDPFTFTFRADQTYSISGSIADKYLKQVLYADRTANPNSIRVYSNARLYPSSNQIGAISSVVLPNFGYGYNTARLTAPVYVQINRTNGAFTTNEEVELLPQSLCLEKTDDEFLLETGDKFLVEAQETPTGIVVSYDSDYGLLKLNPASNRTAILLEDNFGLLTEDGNSLTHEKSALFTRRSFIRGKSSGTLAKILDVSAGGIRANVGAIGLTTGEFLNSDGKISDGAKRIQDSFYYQDYSYVIRIGQSVNKYRDAVKKLLHPVGLALFGEVNLINLIAATIKIFRDASILTARLELDPLSVKMLAAGNWQQDTNRLLVDNSDRYATISLEGGFRDTFITEEGFPLVFENGNTIISERTAPDGRELLLETGERILVEEYESVFFPEHLLQEQEQFFRLEKDNTHTKSRNPDVRKEMWTLFYEDFVPSYSDSDTLKLENAKLDGDGKVEDEGNDLLLEDGGRILNQIQLSKPAPSMRILQSEMLPPVIIDESPLNVVHLLEMSPQVIKEFVFGIKSTISLNHITGFFALEDGSGTLLQEDGYKLATTSKYPIIPKNQSEGNLYVECVPSNTELDNLLLETGYFMLTEDPYPAGTSFVATINAAQQGSVFITGTAPRISFSNEPITGMTVTEGFALPFTLRANFGEGVFESIDYRQDIVPFTIRLNEPLAQAITQNTPLVSLSYRILSHKFKKDDNEQRIYRANFNVVDVPYRSTNALGKSTVQSRASFRQVGSSISFLEQRKFNFPPYTTGSKGSLQVVPGNPYVGAVWQATTAVLTKEVVNTGGNAYEVVVAGTTGSSAPTHTTGTQTNGTAELKYIGPTKSDRTYLPATADGGLTGGWYEQYPAPNRDYWNSEYFEMENGDRLLQESGDEYILEALLNTGDTQIKDFANVTVYDLINRKHKRSNFAVGAYVEVLKTA